MEYPFVQAKNFTKANRQKIDLIVIHDMEYGEKTTSAEWCADFFAGRNGLTAPKASAHYCVDSNSIVQCVRDEDVAWHAPGANANGIGIEHAGYAKQTRAEWLDAYGIAMLQISAELTASLCLMYNIPVQRPTVEQLKAGARGIIGHKDATDAFAQGKGHFDPGPGFPWDWYLARVAECVRVKLAAPPADAVTVNDDWPVVVCNGQRFSVSPIYIWPIGIGQADALAKDLGCELPSLDLVDAIWLAADLKIDATKMIVTDHDGTPETMASVVVFNRQAETLEREIDGRDFMLLAGYCKDVVEHNGKIGLYGWQRPDGTNVQPFFAGHARGWIDYSQGLRLVRRV